MSTPKLTEERLRTWALSQDDRERMCLGICALDVRFSDVRPRRPKGGPDGGRDIEAVFDKREIVWGAVGFKANVTDSTEDKAWVAKKFKLDLDAAKKVNPGLWGFVFFTNVDLTPKEISDLMQYGRDKQLSFIDVFYRERLRIVLDSPRGLSLRYQHLGMTLSEAEQAAFFAEYGSQLEGLLHRGFGALDDRLKRIEFLHDCSKPLISGGVTLTLKQSYTTEDLGHFRFMAEFLNMFEKDPFPSLWIAGRDGYGTLRKGSEVRYLFGVRSLAWSRNPDEQIQNTILVGGSSGADQLHAGAGLHKQSPYKTLGDLDKQILSIYVTKPLFDLISGIYVVMNDYAIAGAESDAFVPLDSKPLATWSEPLSESESAVPWLTVMLKMTDPPSWMPAELAREGWSLDFSCYTPRKTIGV